MTGLHPGDATTALDGGPYELLGLLARGGMAELFLARARAGGPAVVLKRVLAEHDDLATMFLDEVRLAARLQHPNIARVLDVGRVGGAYFYTMEYVHGRNAREVLRRLVALDRHLPIDAALVVLIGVASGLHAAHELCDRDGRPLEIVHRDVSPSNVMVGFDGAVKLVDFGIARAADHVTELRADVVQGKAAYLAPEQITRRPLDRRSDIFALGIVAYELLTRARLFRRDDEAETLRAIVEAPAPAPSLARPDVPPALDAVVLGMLAKDRGERFATAGQVRDALVAIAAGYGMAAPGPAPLAEAMHALFGGAAAGLEAPEVELILGSNAIAPAAGAALAPGRWPAATRPPAPLAAPSPTEAADAPVTSPGSRRAAWRWAGVVLAAVVLLTALAWWRA